jgi:hypothetical protein
MPISARAASSAAGSRHHALDLLDRPGRGVEVGAALPDQKQMATTEHIQRQIAVIVVVAVEVASLLIAEQRYVGGVQVQDDAPRRLPMGFDEQVHQQSIRLALIEVDLVIPAAMPLGDVMVWTTSP